MNDPVKEQIDKGFENLQKTLAEQKADADAKLAKTQEEMKALAEKQVSTDKWISDVEAKQNTARSKGDRRDGLLDAIPKEYRKHIEQAERMDLKDPVHRTALGLWWHFQYMGQKAQRQRLGRSSDEYLTLADNLEKAWGYDPTLKYLGEATAGSSGQLIIATPVEAELMRLIRDNTRIRPLARKIAMTSLTHQIPTEGSNVTAYIVPENTTITDSVATATAFTQIALTAKMFAGLATVQNQLLEDNIIGLQDYLFTTIAEHMGILEDQGACDGNAGNFTGIDTAASVNSFTTAGTTAGGDLHIYADLVKLIYLAQQAQTRMDAYFIMHPVAFKNTVNLTDTNGQPIFQYSNVPNAIPERILGYPVVLSSALSLTKTIKTASTNIYFGPPSRIVFGDLTGMTFLIDPYGVMDKVQTRIRVTKRTAITVPVGTFFSILHGCTTR